MCYISLIYVLWYNFISMDKKRNESGNYEKYIKSKIHLEETPWFQYTCNLPCSQKQNFFISS